LRTRSSVRGLLPVLVVSAIIGLAFLAPARATVNGLLGAYSYSYAGPWNSGPDAVSGNTSTQMAIFILGAAFHTFGISFDGSNFSGATDFGGTATADPGAVFNKTTFNTDVFVRGTDGNIYEKVLSSGIGPWMLFGGASHANFGPDASLQGTTIEDLLVTGTDSQLYWREAPDGLTWGSYKALGGTLTSEPRSISWATGRIDVFARGTDGQMYHRWYVAPNWFGWEALGGGLSSAPTVASCQSGHLEVFVRGTDNTLYRKSFNGTAWSAWSQVSTATWSASPDAVCRPTTNQVDVFDRDFAGNLVRAAEVTAA
jgi:hypothetical protein